MKILSLLTLFLISAQVLAGTRIYDTEEGRHFIEIYEAEGHWVVEDFIVRPGELQEFAHRRSFRLKESALQFADKLQRGRTAHNKSFALTTVQAEAQPLWKVTQEWNLEWEAKYSQWISEFVDRDFFQRHNLATDCADVIYSLRWIFARNNGLPAAGTLTATGALFTHESGKAEWAKLPTHADWDKDKRFLAALNWFLDRSFTGTLVRDAYPVELSSDAVRIGAFYLFPGHVELISQIENGRGLPITIMSSTVPRMVRRLTPRLMTDARPVDPKVGGILQFRWVEKSVGSWKLKTKNTMPYYSLEQYDTNLCTTKQFSLCMFERMGLSFSSTYAISSMSESLVSQIQGRVAVVRGGINYCTRANCAPGSYGDAAWGTQSRDKRLLNSYLDSTFIAKTLNLEDLWNEKLAETQINEVRSGLTLSTFLTRLKNKLVSSDPRQSWAARWGER